MATWFVVPCKAAEESKSRLRGTLDAPARAELVATMLRRVVAAVRDGTPQGTDAMLLHPQSHRPEHGLPSLVEPGRGLNAAVDYARQRALAAGAYSLAVISSDLPAIEAEDVAALAACPRDAVVIAPDHHGTGTNAMRVPLPEASQFQFWYGADSFQRHLAEAERLGLPVAVLRRRGLAIDIDRPQDLAFLVSHNPP